MKNKEQWVQKSFFKNASGCFVGNHMHRIIGSNYEKAIQTYAKGILADLGCGEVPYFFMYKDLVEDNICIDWGKEDGEISFLDYTVDLNLQSIPLEANTVDTILCTDVLEHINNPEFVFKEMTRILKTGGKLILTVPFLYWIHDAPYDHHRYTKYRLRDFCNKNNLEVVELYEYGGLPEVIYDMLWKGCNYYSFKGRKFLFYLLKKVGLIFSRLKFIRSFSERTKHDFPLGYILIAQK